MAAYPTGAIPVTGYIGTTDPADTYATHVDILQWGGMMSVATLTDRNNIPSTRRKFGMFVTVYGDGTAGNNKTYRLCNIILGGTTDVLTDNDNWVEFQGSGGGGGSALNSRTEPGTAITAADADDNYIVYCTAATDVTITMDDAVSTNVCITYVKVGAGNLIFTSDGTSTVNTVNGELTVYYTNGSATWVKRNATAWFGWGALGETQVGWLVTGTTDILGDVTIDAGTGGHDMTFTTENFSLTTNDALTLASTGGNVVMSTVTGNTVSLICDDLTSATVVLDDDSVTLTAGDSSTIQFYSELFLTSGASGQVSAYGAKAFSLTTAYDNFAGAGPNQVGIFGSTTAGVGSLSIVLYPHDPLGDGDFKENLMHIKMNPTDGMLHHVVGNTITLSAIEAADPGSTTTFTIAEDSVVLQTDGYFGAYTSAGFEFINDTTGTFYLTNTGGDLFIRAWDQATTPNDFTSIRLMADNGGGYGAVRFEVNSLTATATTIRDAVVFRRTIGLVAGSTNEGLRLAFEGETTTATTYTPTSGLTFKVTDATNGSADTEFSWSVLVNNTDTTIYYTRGTGLVYNADHSAANAANDRWIPDKAYVDSVAGGGGATLTGSADEILKYASASSGVGTKVFSTSNGNLVLGDSGLAGDRTIDVAGSATNINITHKTKGSGEFIFQNGGSAGGVLISGSREIELGGLVGGTGQAFGLIHAADLTGGSNAGNLFIDAGENGTTANLSGNIGLFSRSATFSGSRMLYWADAEANPSANPSNGLYAYVDGSDSYHLKARLPDGTISTVTASKLVQKVIVENPTASEKILVDVRSRARVITKVYAYVEGTGSPSVTWNLTYASTADSGSPTSVWTVAKTTTSTSGVTFTSFDNNATAADDYLQFITSAISGTSVTRITIVVEGTV
jgi:hypothetical protein